MKRLIGAASAALVVVALAGCGGGGGSGGGGGHRLGQATVTNVKLQNGGVFGAAGTTTQCFNVEITDLTDTLAVIIIRDNDGQGVATFTIGVGTATANVNDLPTGTTQVAAQEANDLLFNVSGFTLDEVRKGAKLCISSDTLDDVKVHLATFLDDTTADGFEPNNITADAKLLSTPKSTSNSASIIVERLTLTTNSDVDFFKVVVPAGTAFTALIGFDPHLADMTLEVLNETGGSLGLSTVDPFDDLTFDNTLGSTDKTVVLRISGTAGGYILVLDGGT